MWTLLIEIAFERLRRASRSGQALRVGVDIRPFYEPLTGVGWYLHHLLHELARLDGIELVGFGDARIDDQGPRIHCQLPSSMRVLAFDLRGLPNRRWSRSFTAAAYLLLIRLTGCDVLFGANFFLPRLLSAVARKRVITIHDLTYRRFPELVQKETLQELERRMSWEIFNADAIICVSESTRVDLLASYELDPRRAVTIHSGVEQLPGGMAQTEPTTGPYLLFAGTIEPRKDLDTLLEAYETLKEQQRYAGDLVIVGRTGWKSEKTLRQLEESPWKEFIHRLDYVDSRKLASLYAGADMFIFPSILEGFGFPLLEAMSHGVPVIAARTSSLPEVGGEAALYFEPRNAVQLAEAIERLDRDPELRALMIERGQQRVSTFPWSRTARETASLFERVARG